MLGLKGLKRLTLFISRTWPPRSQNLTSVFVWPVVSFICLRGCWQVLIVLVEVRAGMLWRAAASGERRSCGEYSCGAQLGGLYGWLRADSLPPPFVRSYTLVDAARGDSRVTVRACGG